MAPFPMKKKRQKYATFRIGAEHIKKAHAAADREDRTVRSIIERALDSAYPSKPAR